MPKPIRTFNTNEFIERNMKPDPKLAEILQNDFGKFFMVKVQDMIKISKLPILPTRATSHTMIYLTSGMASMKVGFHPVKIYKNECLVVPAGQVFSYDKYEVNKGYICNFDPGFLIQKIGNTDLLKDFEFLNIWGNPIIKPDKKTAGFLKQSFKRVYHEYAKNGLKHPEIIQSHFIATLYDLNKSYTPLTAGKSKVSVALTNRFKELLHQHIKTTHLVKDYAGLLNVTPNHLNKVVRDVTGKTPSKWIDEAIITEAKVMLFQTDYPINEIAENLGIYDPSYFSRLFKKQEGLSPSDYRKKIELS